MGKDSEEFYRLIIAREDRKYLIDQCEKGNTAYVAGYLIGRLLQEGELVDKNENLIK